MTGEDILILVARWLHIVSATVAVGVPIFVRMALLPALRSADPGFATQLREGIAARWRVIVYVSIVVFLATGFYNFLGPHAHWRQLREDRDKVLLYHSLMGVKILLAFVIFFLASALAGRTAALARIRANAATWSGVVIVLGLIVVGISNYLRFM